MWNPPVDPKRRRFESSCWLVALLALACGSGKPNAPTPLPAPATVCTPLPPVDVSASANVVGTGTVASCTEASLANALASAGKIRFDCGGAPVTIPITQVHAIDADTVIDGAGLVTLDAGGKTRMFEVALGVSLTLQRLTFQNASVADEGSVIHAPYQGVTLTVIDCVFRDNTCTDVGQDIGGAIATYEADLHISGAVFSGNRGSNGGAIRVISSNLDVVNTTFAGNLATGTGGNGSGGQGGIGGAVYVDAASDQRTPTLSLCGDTFQDNQAGTQGGGVFFFMHPGQSASVASSGFLGNQITGDGGLGGGLYAQGGPLAVVASTFSKNTSTLHAGGVFLGSDTPATFTNCTVEGNTASLTDGNGGGLWTGDAEVHVDHCTLADNQAHYGPGLFAGGSTTLTGSLFANNGGNQWGGKNCAGTYLEGGGNVQFAAGIDNASDVPCTSGVLLGDPKLSPLADNGGPTQTMAITPGSAAEGVASVCPATDQRGNARHAPCDSGAFEL